MKDIYLSIIIPIYNAEKYIAETMQSLLPLASDEQYEFIFINDGSTDRSQEIVDKWKSVFTNCICINQENKGVSSARNKGILAAHGKYLWFVDADDVVYANEAKLLQKKTYNKNSDLIWFSFVNITKGGGTKSVPKPKNWISEKECNTSDYINKYYRGAGMLWAYWLKHSIISEYNLKFDERARWFEDAHFLMQFICHIKNVLISPIILYQYRIHEDSAMRNSDIKDRHRCSIMLNANMSSYLKNVDTDKSIKRGIQKFLSISTAWCIREAKEDYAMDLYIFCQKYKMFPLKLSGNWKQKLQIMILNLNFGLYRKLCRLL